MTTTVLPLTDSGFLDSSSAVLATAQNGLGTVTATNTPVDTNLYAYHLGSGPYQVSESFFEFDLSTITQVVENAVLQLYFDSGSASDGDVALEVYAYDWGGTVDTSDWRDRAWLGSATLLASYNWAQGSPLVPAGLYISLSSADSALKDLVEASRPGTLRLFMVLDQVRLGLSKHTQVNFTPTPDAARLSVIQGATGDDSGTEGVGLSKREQKRRPVKSWPHTVETSEHRDLTTKELAMPVASVRTTSVRPATGSIRTKRDGTL